MTCAPPPDCAGRTDGACAPPPWCQPTPDGGFDCRPPEPGEMRAGMMGPGMHCAPPPAEAASPEAAAPPCAGPMGPPIVVPACAPGPEGQLRCAPPPNCGGTAFAGAGVAGCAPPAFCTANGDAYDCRPPEDCRTGPNGISRCGPPPMGAACQRMLEGEAAQGAFVPCAAPPTMFCPPPPPGEAPRCGAPPAPPRFCAPGEPMFPPDHPTGAPPACIPAPGVENGLYRPPHALLAEACVPPPPGEWPPAMPAPEGRVWCPPAGFMPPPPPGAGFEAWRAFTADKMPPAYEGFLVGRAQRWDAVDPAALDDITRAGAIHQLFAPPSFDGRLVNGSFTRAQLDESMGVRDFSVGGTPFFRDVRPDLEGGSSLATAAGTTVVAASDQAVFESHNVPTGLMAYRGMGEPFTVSFDAAIDGAEGGFVPGEVPRLHIVQRGDWKGIVVGDARLEGDELEADVDAESPVFFMAIPPTGLEAETRLDIAEGIAEGEVFAEVSLLARNGTTAEDLTFYEDPDAFHVEVTETSEDAITVDIGGEGEGQALVFTVDRETLTTPLSELNVTIDGEVMRECASFDELTESAASGGCFHLVANESVIRVSVMPEHFSEHTLVIGAVRQQAAPVEEAVSEEAPAEETPEQVAAEEPAAATPTPAPPPETRADTPDLGVFVIALGVASVALLRRRKD